MYYTRKKDVQLGPGQSLAFQKGRGYYAKGSAPSMYDTALKLAQQQLSPALSEIDSERKQAATNAGNEVTNAQGFSSALAKILGDIAPQTQQTYQQAAGATASFGKGFSDAEQHLRENQSASLTDFLSKAGLPSDVIAATAAKAAPAGLADVQYGLSGYFPAAGLAREGAAYTAAAQGLPAMALNQGAETVQQLLKSAADADLQYGQQRATQQASIPTTARQILNDMINQQQQQESIDVQRQYLGNTQRSTTASITGVDPVTGHTVKGYHVDPKSGRVVKDPTPGATPNPQVVAQKRAAAVAKSAKAREDAFAQAQTHMFDDAKSFVMTTKSDDPLAGLSGHPSTIVQKTPYAQAAKTLFDKYKYLLRFASQSGQSALKRRLNQIIADALAAQGITPVSKAQSTAKESAGSAAAAAGAAIAGAIGGGF